MMALLAQVGGYSFVQIAIFIVITLAIIALVYIFVKQTGIPIPQWLIQVLCIVFAAVVVIIAIKFIASV